jgi:hypothetical protein
MRLFRCDAERASVKDMTQTREKPSRVLDRDGETRDTNQTKKRIEKCLKSNTHHDDFLL